MLTRIERCFPPFLDIDNQGLDLWQSIAVDE
jgi:hypothetical protein